MSSVVIHRQRRPHHPHQLLMLLMLMLLLMLGQADRVLVVMAPNAGLRSFYTSHRLFLVMISRRGSCSFAEYWKYFVTRFNGVHAFGDISAGSERIWMKFEALRVYCLELAWQILGAIRTKARAGAEILFFFVR